MPCFLAFFRALFLYFLTWAFASSLACLVFLVFLASSADGLTVLDVGSGPHRVDGGRLHRLPAGPGGLDRLEGHGHRFHWNRMGFTTRPRAASVRAAQEQQPTPCGIWTIGDCAGGTSL